MGGCTTMRRAMKKQFLKIIASWKRLLISIIVVEKVLKFIEMVLKCEIHFEISEFDRSRTFS